MTLLLLILYDSKPWVYYQVEVDRVEAKWPTQSEKSLS